MIITYYGGQFMKIQQGDLTVAYNPFKEAPEGVTRPARFGADIALVSLNHPHFNGVENLSHGDKSPFSVTGPGEYETKGVYVRGVETSSNYGGSPRLNTIYYVLIEGMRLCMLGALDTAKLGEKVYDDVGEVDILFVPIGGNGVLSPADAHKLSLSFSPGLIVPMQYDAATLKQFLKEAGQEGVAPQEKLTVKKKDMEGKEGEVAGLKVM